MSGFRILLIALIVLLASCAQLPLPSYRMRGDEKYAFEAGEFVGETAFFARCYPNRNLKRMGQYALTPQGKLSRYQTGTWAEYYESGQVRELGEFAVGRYIICAYSPYRGFYHYKTGYWHYYHENGALKACGDYKLESFNCPNCCEGGAGMSFGVVTGSWKFYDSAGVSIQPVQDQIEELERVALVPELGELYWIPDREKGTVRQVYIPE